MNKTIHIREAVTPEEVERFWQELHAYHARDVFPDPAEEDRAYFLDDSQYRAAVQRIHDREGDRCYYLLFRREGRDIGFALTALYPSEDGKCFVMEFCVLPEFRGGASSVCGDHPRLYPLPAVSKEHGSTGRAEEKYAGGND